MDLIDRTNSIGDILMLFILNNVQADVALNVIEGSHVYNATKFPIF